MGMRPAYAAGMSGHRRVERGGRFLRAYITRDVLAEGARRGRMMLGITTVTRYG